MPYDPTTSGLDRCASMGTQWSGNCADTRQAPLPGHANLMYMLSGGTDTG